MLPLVIAALPGPVIALILMQAWKLALLGLVWLALHLYLLIAMVRHCRTIEPAKLRESETVALCILLLAVGLFQLFGAGLLAGKNVESDKEWDGPPTTASAYAHSAGFLMSIVAASLCIVACGRFLISNSSMLVCPTCSHMHGVPHLQPHAWGCASLDAPAAGRPPPPRRKPHLRHVAVALCAACMAAAAPSCLFLFCYTDRTLLDAVLVPRACLRGVRETGKRCALQPQRSCTRCRPHVLLTLEPQCVCRRQGPSRGSSLRRCHSTRAWL
jgi:hypothetical protein